ncbi:tetratricopeptide repeat protein [Deferrisoma sp.]
MTGQAMWRGFRRASQAALAVLAFMIGANAAAAPAVFEEASEAVARWTGEPGRALVLLSRDPYLVPLPPPVRAKALGALGPSVSDVGRGARWESADPPFLPENAVRLALATGRIGALVWVVPVPARLLADARVEIVLDQMRDRGLISEGERATFQVVQGWGRGHVEGVPTVIGFRLEEVGDALGGRPYGMHVDLSYLSALYLDEVRTPVFGLLQDVARQIVSLAKGADGVTFSFSNGPLGVPLDFRFAGRRLLDVMQAPSVLEQPLPTSWRERARALFLSSMLEVEGALTVCRELTGTDPGDPDAWYARFRAEAAAGRTEEALRSLERAATLDAAYGLEYAVQAGGALEAGDLVGALRMLDLALRYRPWDDLARLARAEVLVRLGHERAAGAVEEVRRLAWSPVFHPDAAARVAALAEGLGISSP